MSLRNELMIPFRGIGEVGHRLRDGSAVLRSHGVRLAHQALRRLPRLDKAASLGDKLESLVVGAFGIIGGAVLLAGLAGPVLRLAKPYLGWMVMLIAAAWFVAALSVAPATKAVESGTEKPESAALPLESSAQAIARLVQAVAARRGQRGVHLDELLTHLPGVNRQALLAALQGAGIPIEDQLKLTMPNGKQLNRQGVRVRDIPAHLLGRPGLVVAEPASSPLTEGRPAGG